MTTVSATVSVSTSSCVTVDCMGSTEGNGHQMPHMQAHLAQHTHKQQTAGPAVTSNAAMRTHIWLHLSTHWDHRDAKTTQMHTSNCMSAHTSLSVISLPVVYQVPCVQAWEDQSAEYCDNYNCCWKLVDWGFTHNHILLTGGDVEVYQTPNWLWVNCGIAECGR